MVETLSVLDFRDTFPSSGAPQTEFFCFACSCSVCFVMASFDFIADPIKVFSHSAKVTQGIFELIICYCIIVIVRVARQGLT